MKKNLVLLAVVSFLAAPLVSFSQEPSTQPDTLVWKKKLNFAINLNQASFSSNWKVGEINIIIPRIPVPFVIGFIIK